MEGINPFLKYGDDQEITENSDKSKIDPDRRYLPHGYKEFSPTKLWTSIPLNGLQKANNLNLDEEKKYNVDFKHINIVQTGMDNEARDLFISGWNEVGDKGYYKKSLSEIDLPWISVPLT